MKEGEKEERMRKTLVFLGLILSSVVLVELNMITFLKWVIKQ
jgi:hypothetical protein